MDYEKKYNEALERARALWQEAIEKEYVEDYLKDYETIFPELRESEDERIRKDLIHDIQMLPNLGVLTHRPVSEYIAYLEKQKINTEGDFGRGYDCGYQAGYAVATNEMKPKVATATLATLDSEKQKEQKLAEWNEEDEKMRDNIIYILQKDVTYTPPTRPNSCTGSGNAFYTHQTEIDWLKSLRPPFKPSEE